MQNGRKENSRFFTDFVFRDRETKAEYVWRKYESILRGNVLDVGSDEGYLKAHLPEDTSYTGIGLGGSPDHRINLENEPIPFPPNSFACVLCLDVLEHLENIHNTFDELCRVAKRYVIISLPNPYACFGSLARYVDSSKPNPMKFYGLPPEKPEDRHKWFFGAEDAEQFVRYRAEKNGMTIVQLDGSGYSKQDLRPAGRLHIWLHDLFSGQGPSWKDMHAGMLWAVLEKNAGTTGSDDS